MYYFSLFRKLLFVYIFLLIFFILSLILVCSLPSENIKFNINKSIPLLETEGDYPILGGEQKSYQLDNFTDSYMLNIIYNIDNSKPFYSAIRAVHYSKKLSNTNSNSKVALLKNQINNNAPGNSQYPRYWHGYMIYIRPMLLILTYSDIRKFYELVFFTLITIITSLIYKKLSLFISINFIISLALINFIIIPFSLQFSSVFFVAFISIIILLIYKLNTDQEIILFFIIGACTSFVDFLTAPLVTFGLPVIILIILHYHNNKNTTFKNDLLLLISIGIAWVSGYLLLWGSKWILASIILKENILMNGISAIYDRTWGITPNWLDNSKPLYIHSISSNINYLFIKTGVFKWLFLYMIPFLFFLLFIRWHQKLYDLKLPLLLSIISFLPYSWFIIASNHSAIHCWFTYRIQVISIMSILCAMYYAIDINKFKFDISNVFSKLVNIDHFL